VCFDVKLGEKQLFLKTHLPGAGSRANLVKEADIFSQLYGSAAALDRFEVSLSDETSRLCLLMPMLAPLTGQMHADSAISMARDFSERLKDRQGADLPSFEQYLRISDRATKTLQERQLLEKESAIKLSGMIARLEGQLAKLPWTLCHGDFGPKNILVDGAELRVIDWEDAFRGVAGYDYLYWLTFMENRRLLKTAAFGRTGLEPDVEHAILALVVLLKSYLAVCSGAYLSHAVPIQARIDEILDLRR
jgi:hypothetical protein